MTAESRPAAVARPSCAGGDALRASPPGPAAPGLALASATDILAALESGAVGAEELCVLHLERIARYNPALHAVVTDNGERARAVARRADEARSRGRSLGPLHGLPVTLKDTIDVRGLVTTCGLPSRARSVAARSSPVAAAVQRAGAVLLGKTNVPPHTTDWQTENRLFGRTPNPWNHTRTAGGSTGGGATAVAAGLSTLEIGSDIAGSIGVPAAFCGVYGHRPSETLIPRHGHVPGSPVANPARIMGVLGPLARDPRDLELALGVLAGAVPGEAVAWRLDLPAPRRHRLADFQVAVLPPIPWLPLDPAVEDALQRTAWTLAAAGARVQVVQPPGLDVWQHQRTFATLLGAMLFARVPASRRRTLASHVRRAVDASPPNPFAADTATGILASAPQLLALLERRECYRSAFRSFFRSWDVLLAPVVPVPPFPHLALDLPFERRTLALGGGQGPTIPYGWLEVLPGLASLSGQPATTFPAGRTADGLPLGLQAIGPYLEDRTPIAFVRLLGELTGGYHPPPGIS